METWRDIMPAIPLENSVPLAREYGAVTDSASSCVWGYDFDIIADDDRVDLDDPQGFTYALRWLTSKPAQLDILAKAYGDVDVEWAVDRATLLLLGQIPIREGDRLALAKALREIVS